MHGPAGRPPGAPRLVAALAAMARIAELRYRAGMELDVRALRKAELHCHLDGVLDPAMVDQLARTGEPLALDAAALRACHPVRSLDHWMTGYAKLVEPALVPRERWLARLLELHAGRLRAQRVVYAEILVSGLLFARDDESALVDVFTELRARADAAAGPDLQLELVICIGRGPPDKVARQVPRIVALRRAGLIRGVALAGLDERAPVQPLERWFTLFRDLGLGIEIHAGELAGADSVRDAIRHGAPDRLGHALAAFTDDALLAEIADRGIHVEFCPTSNLIVGGVAQLADHPIGRAHALGLSFSINTDDPGPFACSLTSEFAAVARTFGFDQRDFERIFDATMRAAFKDR